MNELNEYLTTELDATHRIAVYYDLSRYAYEDITGDMLGVFTLRNDTHLSRIEGGHLTDELKRLARNVHEWQLESAVRKYLTISGQCFKEIALQGYSQSDWATVLVYGDGPWITGAAEDLQRWFRGDIYTLAYQELTTYTAPNGNTIERWETLDSLGCVTADTQDEVMTVARDHFALEKVAA